MSHKFYIIYTILFLLCMYASFTEIEGIRIKSLFQWFVHVFATIKVTIYACFLVFAHK